MTKIDSIVIVANEHGYTATMRFSDPKLDEIISAPSHWMIYEMIDKKIINKLGAKALFYI